MTMYAPTDVHSINLGPHGCGQSHDREDAGERMILKCPQCEADLQTRPSLGWGTHPAAVALTCDEIAENKRNEEQSQRVGMQRLAAWTAEAAAATGTLPAAVTEMLAKMQGQITALSDQNAALVETLAKMQAPEGGPEDVAAAGPVKRGPGRPRKDSL